MKSVLFIVNAFEEISVKNSLHRASLQQVAERAGVSRMTASNVVRGRDAKTSAATRERVLDAMRELHYTPVAPPSKQNRHVETRIIGLFFDCIDFEDVWGTQTYRGMRDAARASHYDLLILLRPETDSVLPQEELRFLDRRSDGVIFVVPQNRESILETMVLHRIPALTVSIDADLEAVPSVVLDNEGALQTLTEYLIQKGHQKIVHLTGPQDRWDFRMRRRGYESAMHKARLEPLVVVANDLSDVAWREALSTLMAQHGVTAVACVNDLHAFALCDWLSERGLNVPRDVSVVSLDDLPEAAARGLTTLRYSSEEFGRRAIEGMVKLLNGAPPQTCGAVVKPELIERASVSELASRKGAKVKAS